VGSADRSLGAPARAREEAPQPARVVVGVLLCGGRSARMGSDKAGLVVGGRVLMDYPLRVLREVADEVVLACGPQPRYAELGLALALDGPADGGPLAGLVAGLEAARERGADWSVVLACDMPRAEARVLRALLQRAQERDLDACLLGLARGSQATFAAYHVRCAGPAQAALAAGERRLVAFHGASAQGRKLRIEVVPAAELGASEDLARNLNTPEELEAERAALARGGAR